jgi:hypothetical protein
MSISEDIKFNCCGTTCDKIDTASKVKGLEDRLIVLTQLAFSAMNVIDKNSSVEACEVKEKLVNYFGDN